MTSAVFIIPAAHVDAGNALGEAMGWGAGCFSVPLTDGNGVSHYGCRADVTSAFVALLANPPTEAEPVLAVLVSDLRDTDAPRQHWLDVLEAQGLAVMPED